MWTVWLSHSKWLSKYSNESTSNFVLSVNIPPQKLFGWFRSCSYGNWWLAASSQCTCSCITSHAEILGKHQITQVTQPHYSPDLVPCDFWLFQKLKSPLNRKIFQTINKIQENTVGQLMATGRTVWCPNLEGDWGVIVLCTMFLVSHIFFNKCLYFS